MKTPLLLAVLILSVTGGNRLLGQELSVPSQNTFSSTDGLWLGGIPLGFRYDAGQTNLALGFQGQYFWEKRGQKDFPRLGFGFRAQYLFGANLNFGSRYFTHGFVLSPEFLVLQPLFDRVYFLGSLKAPYSRSEGQLRMLLPPQDTIRIVGEQSVIALYVGLMLDFRSWFLQISSPVLGYVIEEGVQDSEQVVFISSRGLQAQLNLQNMIEFAVVFPLGKGSKQRQ